jgi:uncharacterized protein
MVIIDTGPIVALFDESEPLHKTCKATLKRIRGSILTTWPVLTESFYLLGDWQKGHNELWKFIVSGGLNVQEVPAQYYSRLRDLMEKYSDRPMDLADATLVLIAEIHKVKTVFTLDRKDFLLYRPKHYTHFNIIPDK